MNDLQKIEMLLQEIKQLPQDDSKKTKRIIADKMSMISSLAQTVSLTYIIGLKNQ